jgi:RecA-family ATPase
MTPQPKDWADAHVNGAAIREAADRVWADSMNIHRKPGWRDQIFTAAELQKKQFPPVRYVVPNLIPEGLTLLCGRPKVGKSWAALEVAIAATSGGECFGGRLTERGDVLYAALEDNPRRLQRRIDKLLSPVSTKWPDGLTLTTAWRRLDKGGVTDIADWIKRADRPRLVILDTLAGVKPIRNNSGYAEDYDSLTALHRLANDVGIGVLVLHHTRKLDAEDPLDTISGTLGLAGCADTALVFVGVLAGNDALCPRARHRGGRARRNLR